jgi:hypothetical protein
MGMLRDHATEPASSVMPSVTIELASRKWVAHALFMGKVERAHYSQRRG